MANTFVQKNLSTLTTAFAVGAQAGVDVHTPPVDGESEIVVIHVSNPFVTDKFLDLGLDIGEGVIGMILTNHKIPAGMVTRLSVGTMELKEGHILKVRSTTAALLVYSDIIDIV